MKSVTEFPSFKLVKGQQAKTALAAEGKSPEEVSTAIGEQFKLEGDKLKFFIAACEVAAQNADKLARVLVCSLNEGEATPPKATKIEDHVYVPEFMKEAKPIQMTRTNPKGGPKGGPKKQSGPKESPWGLSPEQKLAKKNAGKKAAASTEG